MAITAAAAYSRDGERRLTADGAVLDDAARWKESLPVRTFAPDDLRLIKGSPRRRREYLDSLAGRSHPEYPETLRRYEEALSQRNFLLRTSRGDLRDPEFEPWEALLAATGLLVSRWRAAALSGVRGRVPADPRGVDGRAGGRSAAGLPDERRRPGRGGLQGQARREPGSRPAADLHSPRPPPRRSAAVFADGLDMRECASQGEQRTALLALVLAEWGQLLAGPARPLLLLDDVMSELDPSRRGRLVALARRGGQTVITTTDLRYFSPEELELARVIDLGPGGRGPDG